MVWLNGEARVVAGSDALLPASSWLRDVMHLHGTKVACGTGDCGACTILVATPPLEASGETVVRWQPVNSCLRLMVQLHGCHIVTVEGLATASELAPAQRAMMARHASQCGFCTPGFALTMTAALESDPSPVNWRDALAGNVCRCTGYAALLEAATQAEAEAVAEAGRGARWMQTRYPLGSWQPQARGPFEQSLIVTRPAAPVTDAPVVCRPATVSEALLFLQQWPQSQIVAGATDVGVDGVDHTRPVLSIDHLTELAEWSVEPALEPAAGAEGPRTLVLGALTRWRDLPEILTQMAGSHAATMSALIARVGGPQIRAAGTVGGNIMTASPIGDLLPLLLTLNASVELRSAHATRVVPLQAMSVGYRAVDRRSGELLTRVFVPLPRAGEQLRLEKVSRRHDVDIATVSLAARWREEHGMLRDVHLAVGGMGPAAARLTHTEGLLNGAPCTAASWAAAAERCHLDVTPRSDVRGSASYRLLVLQTLITQLYRAAEASA